MKHSSGPWIFYQMGLDKRKGFQVCKNIYRNHIKKYGFAPFDLASNVTKADAHLIIAAPEMLRALEHTLEPLNVAIDNAWDDPESLTILEEVLNMVETAINKAKGIKNET